MHEGTQSTVRKAAPLGRVTCAILFMAWHAILLGTVTVAACTAVKVDVDGSFDAVQVHLHSHRHLQPTSPTFFDDLRVNLSDSDVESNITRGENSSIYEVTFLLEDISATVRLAEIKSFLPFSKDGMALPVNRNEGFGVLLALQHLNQMSEKGHPVATELVASDPALSMCNIRFTMELFDGQFSPTVTTRTITAVMQREVSLASPRPTGVIGAYYTSETLPLAILTGVNDIPQISASATSIDLDSKEQFPLFGRTVTNTDGEATAAVRFFQTLRSTHVAVLFVTVRSSTQKTLTTPHIAAHFSTPSLGPLR
jgi:Receptor family ligand binding region